ncbi:hypothetical protein BH18ACT4_BH18ACT4_07160 [soil metagenome]
MVCGAVAIVTRLVTSEVIQPATDQRDERRGGATSGRAAPGGVEHDDLRPGPESGRQPGHRYASTSLRTLADDGDGEAVATLPWWQRLRSAILLTVTVVAVGVGTAVAVGVTVVAVITLLRTALG